MKVSRNAPERRSGAPKKTKNSVLGRVRMVHEKNGSDTVPNFSSTISADAGPGPIYQGTHTVTCKRRLVHEFFAKYMLQIGYLTYCTTVSKCYLHLFVFSFVLFQ